MGEHSKEPVTWGAMMARDENDRMVGYQAFRAERGEIKMEFVRELVGPVRPTYQEAAKDAREARLKGGQCMNQVMRKAPRAARSLSQCQCGKKE
jgi:hypothetical protein